ncbi:GNAT family N-acetyltransferase [Mucilaginibacter limnophilus]|uniref:GNAT family N-acetyltransferase n=1 Tax=Mucilaginibacter limnophilus TaxID=1932778 RepID=A0A3S2URN9_9SPHI|nr:GNAT family N-acetyltransferase [Mucilaginibacter limnophilus]RVU03005.1 GNAT family N-acetyltransferase [Mucilaginibacter limnophilus]
MAHILDNPIYNALISGNREFAAGADPAFFFHQDVAPFAGLKDASEKDFELLGSILPNESVFVIFSRTELVIPKSFQVLRHFNMYQMVYNGYFLTSETDNHIIKELGYEDVSEMLALTQLTNPGPFLPRTIEFGNYTGVFNETKLVAMAGHRMQPLPYAEISAVCTHPNHVGKGYATILLKEQINRILKAGKTPFLHVLQENKGAISVYKRIGFKTRAPMFGYVLSK